MRIVDATAVGVERVDHLEEALLAASRLGGGMQGRRARMLTGNRKVAEDERAGSVAQPWPVGGAARAAEVGVDDDPLLPLVTNVVIRPHRGDLGAPQIGHEARTERRR